MNKGADLHIDLPFYEIADDGQLLINKRPILNIAAQCDGPFYAYDASILEARIQHLREALPSAVDLHYAMKANPMPEVVQYVAERVDGLDVASSGELQVALETKIDPREISFAGPAKSRAELEHAIRAGIVLNVESPTELTRIGEIATRLNVTAGIAIRVNPDFELKASGMRMSGGAKQFGIDAEQVPDVLQKLSDMPVEFEGLHIFTGSQNLSAEAICEAQDKSMSLALQLCRGGNKEPRFLNLGGGFGIPYFPGDQRLSLDSIGANLSRLDAVMKETFPRCKIVIELGRYIVGEAGVYVCEITDVKVSRGHTFLITNGGLHHHLSASGNFGQVIRKNYPLAIANNMNGLAGEPVSVVGPLCTPLDLLGDKMALSKAGIGDYVVIFQSGAYGFTASPHLFLSHPAPTEIFCE